MQNLEDIQKNWKGRVELSELNPLTKLAWQTLLVKRVNKQKNTSLKYFWASFVYQIIVYGLLSHVIVKHWEEILVWLPGVFCLLLYVPFTIVLMQKFKRMALLQSDDKSASDLSIKDYVHEQYRIITSFYRFKIRYEYFLVPLSSMVFVWILFKLYVPGGVMAYPKMSILLFIIVMGACAAAVLAENNRNFKKPIRQLEEVLKDINAL